MSLGDVVVWGLRASLAVVLLASGSSKLADLDAFTETVQKLFGPRPSVVLARGAGAAVCLGEILLGLLSLVGVVPGLIDALIFTTFGLLALVGAFAVLRRPELDCRCFGSLARTGLGKRSLTRAAILAASAAIVVLTAPRSVGSWPWLPRLMIGSSAALFSVLVAQAAGSVGLVTRTLEERRR